MASIKLNELITYLQGTCKTLSEATEEIHDDLTEDDLTDEDKAIIDQEIFQCADCSWWYEVAEMSGDEDETICSNCYGGE